MHFCRKCLGWPGAEFAAHMGVSAERLLRLATLTREPAADYSLGLLKDMARTEPVAKRLQVRVEKGRWNAEAA